MQVVLIHLLEDIASKHGCMTQEARFAFILLQLKGQGIFQIASVKSVK